MLTSLEDLHKINEFADLFAAPDLEAIAFDPRASMP